MNCSNRIGPRNSITASFFRDSLLRNILRPFFPFFLLDFFEIREIPFPLFFSPLRSFPKHGHSRTRKGCPAAPIDDDGLIPRFHPSKTWHLPRSRSDRQRRSGDACVPLAHRSHRLFSTPPEQFRSSPRKSLALPAKRRPASPLQNLKRQESRRHRLHHFGTPGKV